MRIGNAKINTNPCTQAEQNANWNVVNQFLQNFTALANADHKVAVNQDDEDNATADFLDAKIESSATPNPGQVPVRAVAYNDLTELFYWDASEIDNWNNTDKLYLVLDGGVPVWQLGTNDIDTKTVLVSATDSTDGYFHDCVEDTDTIVGGTDLIVVGNVVGGSGTDQTERFAVDVSAISSFHATEFRVLGIEGGTSAYKTVTQVGVQLVADATFLSALDSRYKKNIRKGRVTVAIPAATGPLTAQWGTTGKVKLQDATTGAVSASEIFVDNDNIETGWVVDSQVTVDTDYSPPRVIGGSCSSVSWS